jgi:medium-chain acyl-[acyl-carrier-protein] hydrolase
MEKHGGHQNLVAFSCLPFYPSDEGDYRMDSYRFKKDYRIIYCNTSKNLKATPVAILQFLEDAAISHSDSSNLGLDDLMGQGVSWVLSRWRLRIMRYPVLNERIRVETWASSFERFRASREFEIFDETGDVIATASSKWIFINTATKRPARIPAGFAERYGADPSAPYEDALPGLKGIENPGASVECMVRKKDIDSNGHVNNVVYLEWMLEAVDEETCDSHYPETIDIVYKNEINYGAGIESVIETISKDGDLETLHEITEKGRGAPCALGRVLWGGRNK